jgi:lysophospholipid acyltransferase (LPLAT)-like uncharacterized protein
MTSARAAALEAALRTLAASWRVERIGRQHHDAVTGGPFLFALWHQALVPLLWDHRWRDIALLVSQHRDGDVVGRAAERLGYRLIRGSSTRGGRPAFREVVQALRRGVPVAITPDGPRGPGRVVKPGIVRAARLAGVPILPVMASADRAWRVESWDRLLVPQPFARLRVRYGPPMHIAGHDDVAAGAQLASQLDALIDAEQPVAA